MRELEYTQEFAAKEDLPETLAAVFKNKVEQLKFEDPDDTGNRQVHLWIKGEPGCGKTRFANGLRDTYRTCTSNYTDYWTQMNEHVQIIILDEFVS